MTGRNQPRAAVLGVSRSIHIARVYPDSGQAERLDIQGHAARGLWNLLHEWHLSCMQNGRKIPAYAEADRQIRDARNDPPEGFEWLAKLPSQASQQVLKHYRRAWDRCFRKVSRSPRFKSRHHWRLAVDVPHAKDMRVRRLSRKWGELTAMKVGRLRFRWTRPLPGVCRGTPGRLTGARLVKEANGWHVAFRIETPNAPVPANDRPSVGVDRGVTRTLALSDGTFHDVPASTTAGEAKRLLRLERKAARQHRSRPRNAPASNRLNRSYNQIAMLHARAKRRRGDWAHKVTTGISRSYGLVAVERLNIPNMTRSARGTVAEPGKNVAQKAGLNRGILGSAWGIVGDHLAYKTAREGGSLVKVPAAYTSQRCSVCGHVDPKSRKSQAEFVCTRCGWSGNADTNAAINVRSAAGQGVSPGPKARVVHGRGAAGVARGREASTTPDAA